MKERLTLSDHGLFSYPVQEEDLEGLSAKQIKREKWVGWTVVSSAWWIAIGHSRLEHFEGICGGDAEAARLLMPIILDERRESETGQGQRWFCVLIL
jgi:hypothetical protein